jgi:uncharacterized membrane protein (UPF0136 family)
MVEIAKLLVGLLAILCLGGGIMGFKKANSKASLIAGSISAVLLAISFSVARFAPTYGLFGGLVVAALLLAHFGRSYLKSKKPMPAIPMMVSSGITIVAVIIALFSGH